MIKAVYQRFMQSTTRGQYLPFEELPQITRDAWAGAVRQVLARAAEEVRACTDVRSPGDIITGDDSVVSLGLLIAKAVEALGA